MEVMAIGLGKDEPYTLAQCCGSRSGSVLPVPVPMFLELPDPTLFCTDPDPDPSII
jgi:hypothetical protein